MAIGQYYEKPVPAPDYKKQGTTNSDAKPAKAPVRVSSVQQSAEVTTWAAEA